MEEIRKIFNLANGESKFTKLSDKKNLYADTISAAGCLFYKDTTDGKYVLLIKYDDPKWPLLDDFGGRVDNKDITVYDTIIREVMEETNNVISESHMRGLIMNEDNKHFYTKQSKYYLILIKVDDLFYPNKDIFGNKEEHDQIYRTIAWYKFDHTVQQQLSHRLSYNQELMIELESK